MPRKTPSGGSLYRTRRSGRSPSLWVHLAAAWNVRRAMPRARNVSSAIDFCLGDPNASRVRRPRGLVRPDPHLDRRHPISAPAWTSTAAFSNGRVGRSMGVLRVVFYSSISLQSIEDLLILDGGLVRFGLRSGRRRDRTTPALRDQQASAIGRPRGIGAEVARRPAGALPTAPGLAPSPVKIRG